VESAKSGKSAGLLKCGGDRAKFFDAIPQSSSGKILLKVLRDGAGKE